MLHIVRLIQRRHPERARGIVTALVIASVLLLLTGLALRWAG